MVLKIKKSDVFLAHGQYHDKASSFFIQAEMSFFAFPMPQKKCATQPRVAHFGCLVFQTNLALVCLLHFGCHIVVFLINVKK